MKHTRITAANESRLNSENGLRRCGNAYYDHQTAYSDEIRQALAVIIQNLLGDNHPGYTMRELVELGRHKRGARPLCADSRASALRLQGARQAELERLRAADLGSEL